MRTRAPEAAPFAVPSPTRLTRVRVLDEPTRYRPLQSFSCGDEATSEWVVEPEAPRARPKTQPVIEVNEIVGRISSGQADSQTVMILEGPIGLVGVGGVRRHPYKGAYPIAAEAYINVLGRDHRYADFQPEAGVTSGYVVLRGALEQIWTAWGDMPAVWALVWSDNGPSQRLFDELGFEYFMPEAPGCQTIRFRPAGLPVPQGELRLENARHDPPHLS